MWRDVETMLVHVMRLSGRISNARVDYCTDFQRIHIADWCVIGLSTADALPRARFGKFLCPTREIVSVQSAVHAWWFSWLYDVFAIGPSANLETGRIVDVINS